VRRGIFTVGVVLAVVFAGVASARTYNGPVAPVGDEGANTATAILAPAVAGAPSALTLKLHGELQCGKPRGRIFTVRLPAAMNVPDTIVRTGVTFAGSMPAHVAVKAHVVTVTAPLHTGAICDIVGPGSFSIAFKRDAGLRNPANAGSYAFGVSGKPGGVWNGTLTVH
jgi:hypothetical protein